MSKLALACAMFRLDPKTVYRTAITPMPGSIRRYAEQIVEPKQCYDNCRRLMEQLVHKNMKYVVGVGFHHIPFEHAILQLEDGTFVDPTLEIINPSAATDFVVGYSLDFGQLVDVMIKLGRAPSLVDMVNLKNDVILPDVVFD
ncbi:hypothetical protein [uncultured Photobacterium sp.]|uniref:hypothetical protein n=1 Tax=uncultured Photobacterium sp. TaxID=173973 RepID=UPI002608C082|nr:hypothetical protein [uncultured Photobacterium sp.]